MYKRQELVAGARAAGLPVTLDLPPVPDLPPALDLAAYRVVQEGLTNVLRHAPGAPVAVGVAVGSEVMVTVRNGPGSAPPGVDPGVDPGGGPGGGHGLAGMRERVRLAGGTLRAGPVPGGGWLVEARLPAGSAAETMPG